MVRRLSKLFSLGARQENPPPVEPAIEAAAGSQFSLDSLEDRDDPAEKPQNHSSDAVLQAFEAELAPPSGKTVAAGDASTLRRSVNEPTQKTESVTESDERNVRGKQCAVVEKSQLVGSEASPVEPEFDRAPSTTTLTTPCTVTCVPAEMTSPLGNSELPSVPTVVPAHKMSDSTDCSMPTSTAESLEKRKRNKRSRRRKSSGGKTHATMALDSTPPKVIEVPSPSPVDSTSEKIIPTDELEDSSPIDSVEMTTDSSSPLDGMGEKIALIESESSGMDTTSASDCKSSAERSAEQSILDVTWQTEASVGLENFAVLATPESQQDADSCDQTRSPSATEIQELEGPCEHVDPGRTCGGSNLTSRNRSSEEKPLEIEASHEVEQKALENSDLISAQSEELSFGNLDQAPEAITNEQPFHQIEPTNLTDQDGMAKKIDDEQSATIIPCGATSFNPREDIEACSEPCPDVGDESPRNIHASRDASDIRGVDDQSGAHSSEQMGKLTLDTERGREFAVANPVSSGALDEIPRESAQKEQSEAARVAAPETAAQCGLFVPLDSEVSQTVGQGHKTRHRKNRSPDYRNEANRKLMEYKKLQTQLPVSQRPSKKLREECSMTSPAPGDSYDVDSLNTTADSISPDSSFAQDLTYDIVDDEPRESQRKMFTFGLEAAGATAERDTSARTRKASEESPSLASEEESDSHGYPGGAALQLSVSISNGFNERLAPCSMNVEDLVKSQECSTDLLSFSYIPGSHRILVPNENISQRQQAVRVVVSSRVESFDEPADHHSSYIRSPRLESWGRKPAAIVSPMRTPALSKAVQTQSLPNFDSDEPASRVVQGLRSALLTYEQVVGVLKKKLEDFSKNNSTSSDALAKELTAEKSNNQKLEQTVNTLERAVQSTMLRMGEVRSANSELREVVQSQLDTLTQYKSQIEDLHFEKDQLKASHENYVAQCEERMRREKHSFEKQAALMKAQMEMKNMDLDRLQHEAKIMRDQLAACQKVIDDLQQY